MMKLPPYIGVFVHPEVKKWVAELHSMREQALRDKDTSS